MTHSRTLLALCLAGFATLSVAAQKPALRWPPRPPASLHSPAVNARAQALLKRLTLRQKIALLDGHGNWFTNAIPAAGIPALKMSDASVGVRAWGRSTAYPASVALAATWDPALAKREGISLGRDARARGVDILLGPGMDIAREPQNGRNFEYLGEDPLLAGTMAAAWIRGLQSQGVAACAKHYAGNEQETDRMKIDSIIGERALREIYLPPFRDAVQQGHVMTIMAAYNRVNGIFSSANPYLLTTMLRKRWGFKGLVMSDWGATHDTLGPLQAGLDLEMPEGKYFKPQAILPLLKSGQLTQAEIDRHVLRLLRVIVAMHFLDGWQEVPSLPWDNPASAATAERVERQAVVLLKNRDHLLPLDHARLHRIVVVGPDASPAVTGGWGSSYTKPIDNPVSLLAAVRAAAGPGVQVTFLPYPLPMPDWYWYTHGKPAPPLPAFSAADSKAIRAADVVIAGVGPRESEGVDRGFHMPSHEDEYLKAVSALNPHTVVVLYAGDNVAMSAWIHQVPALLDAWYPGQNGNTAVAGILFGSVDPSGHLPVSFARHWRDNPAYGHYPGHNGKVHFAEGIEVGYRWYDTRKIAPRYPFGFGLSYTTFTLAKPRLVSTGAARRRALTITLPVSNTGARAGAEVVQLYVRPPRTAGVQRTFQQLRGFARIALQPGQTKPVTFHLHWKDFAYFDPARHHWTVPAGSYQIALGDSSRHVEQTLSVRW